MLSYPSQMLNMPAIGLSAIRAAIRSTICVALLFNIWLTSTVCHACTVGVVNGNITPDGRPIHFKNRDTRLVQQRLGFFSDPAWEHSYLGIYNAGGSPTMGLNDAGLVSGNARARAGTEERIEYFRNGQLQCWRKIVSTVDRASGP